jgi:hypothetical protein
MSPEYWLLNRPATKRDAGLYNVASKKHKDLIKLADRMALSERLHDILDSRLRRRYPFTYRSFLSLDEREEYISYALQVSLAKEREYFFRNFASDA